MSNTDAVSQFIEQAENINQTVAQISESISSDSISQTVESVTESGLSNFVNSEALENSFEAINQQMENLIKSTEEIKEELLNQDLEGYLANPAINVTITPDMTSEEMYEALGWPQYNPN